MGEEREWRRNGREVKKRVVGRERERRGKERDREKGEGGRKRKGKNGRGMAEKED